MCAHIRTDIFFVIVKFTLDYWLSRRPIPTHQYVSIAQIVGSYLYFKVARTADDYVISTTQCVHVAIFFKYLHNAMHKENRWAEKSNKPPQYTKKFMVNMHGVFWMIWCASVFFRTPFLLGKSFDAYNHDIKESVMYAVMAVSYYCVDVYMTYMHVCSKTHGVYVMMGLPRANAYLAWTGGFIGMCLSYLPVKKLH